MTALCLAALAANRPRVTHEVVVVNNGSTDATRYLLRRHRRQCRVITNRENRGFAAACNQGAARARGEYLVFLNNDTLPHPGWLDALVDVARREANVGAVGARLLSWDGQTLLHAGVAVGEHPGLPLYLHCLYRGAPADFAPANRQRDVPVVTGACLLVPRWLFQDLGGFDPEYRNGFEDVDLCLRLRQRGWRVIYTPRAVLRHYEHASPGRHDHDAANYQRLCGAWAGRVQPDLPGLLAADGYTRDPFDPRGEVTP